ncbi:MAG: GIY-YIG nuclease family protein [Bacteroidales bacterium]|nr:GIY-YIG nuclease family protein [Bacteroidales bacterium]
MKGFMYILRCSDERLYTGSTVDLHRRIEEHQSGNGSNFTKNRLPVMLVYFEEYSRIDKAFSREKQIQRWSRSKKEALISANLEELHKLATCLNLTHYMYKKK